MNMWSKEWATLNNRDEHVVKGGSHAKDINFLDTASTVGNTFWPRLRKFTYICVVMLIFLLALSFHVLILKLKFKNILIPIMY